MWFLKMLKNNPNYWQIKILLYICTLKLKVMKLSEIKLNPNNPRVIKDDKFDKLVKSITEFPKMMALRPMVINSDNIVLGGNMRLKALKEIGYKRYRMSGLNVLMT